MVKFVLWFNPNDLESLLRNRGVPPEEAFDTRAIKERYIETEEMPRIGETIMYPIFGILNDELKYWIHKNIGFRVTNVIHNPNAISFSGTTENEKNNNEVHTMVIATPCRLPMLSDD